MKQYIKAVVLNMAQEEIRTLIPQDTIDRIKKNDPSPEFCAYCVGHEGDAQAQELSFGKKISKAFHYAGEMMTRLVDRLQFGTPLFHMHAGSNSSAGREQIGEVVGKALRTIKDKVSAVAAVYIYPKFRSMPLDVASIEANVVYTPKGNSRGDVVDVEQVSGIALASSATEKPAFPGATLLGVIQALQGAETMLTKEEIKEAIKEGKFKVTDIFDAADIVDSEPAQEAKKKEREYGKRKEKEFNDEHERVIDLQKKHDEQVNKNKDLTQKVNSTTSKTLVDASMTARKLGDKQKAFIAKNVAVFKSDKEGEDLKQDVEKFVDAQLKEFEETAKLLGVDIKSDTPDAGTPPADGKGTTGDLSNPKENDFIPAE